MDKCNVSKLPSPAKTQIEKLRARRDKAERESVSGPQSPSGSISPSPPPKRAAPVLKNEAPLSSSKPIDGVDQTPDWAEIPNLGEYRGNWRRVTPPVPEAGADPLRGEGAASAPLSSEESESEDSEIGASVDPFQALSDEVTSWEDQEANSLTLFTPEKPNSWALDANTEKAMTPLTDTDIANIVDYSSDDDYDSLLTYLEDLEIQGSFKALRTNKVRDITLTYGVLSHPLSSNSLSSDCLHPPRHVSGQPRDAAFSGSERTNIPRCFGKSGTGYPGLPQLRSTDDACCSGSSGNSGSGRIGECDKQQPRCQRQWSSRALSVTHAGNDSW